ncbi:bridge-like lipid transfer protein family member 1 [Ornithodoros turicata]
MENTAIMEVLETSTPMRSPGPSWNTTAPLEHLPLDSNFAWLLCALLGAIVWVIYISFYNSRVVGFILTKILNRFISDAYLNIGSISLSVLSGKVMFRDVAYVTPDFTTRVQDGWLVFRWWSRYTPKEFPRTCTDAEARVSVQLNGLEMHVYNRSHLYARLERLFGLESQVLGPDEDYSPCEAGDVKEPEKVNGEDLAGWRDLVPVVKVEVSTGRFVFGNRLLPTTLCVSFEDAHASYRTRAASSRLDLYQHMVDCRANSFKVMLAPSPKYIGIPDEPPRFMGEGFVVVQSNNLDLFYYQDEPGLVPAEPEVVELADGALVERRSAPTWGIDIKCGRGTTFCYGPWADRQRDHLFRFFYPQDFQPVTPTPPAEVGERRRFQSFDIRLSTTADATFDILFSREKETNAIHVTVKQGSYLEVTIPWTSTEEGYSSSITGQLFHVEASTSLHYRNLLESEIFGFDVQTQYPLIWNGYQDWQCNLTGCRASVTLVHAHKGFLQALVEDWSCKARPDILHFVPYTWHVSLILTEFELLTLANEHNWLDCSSQHQENACVAFCGDVLDLSFDLPFVDFLPPQVTLKFWIQAESVNMLLFLPEGDPHRELLLLLDKHSRTTERDGSPRPAENLADKKWHSLVQKSEGWVNVCSVPIVALSMEYFYHPVPQLDFHLVDFDVTTPEKEELLLSPMRPPKGRMPLPPKDFDPGSLTPDVLSLELEIGPSVMALHGTLLHLLIQLKENYFGASQEYVDLDKGASVPTPPTPHAEAFDPRVYRPLDVKVTLIMHDIHGHLMKACGESEPPCPSLYMERLHFELYKSFRETKLTLLLSPLVLVSGDDNGRLGHMVLSSLQVRGHAMFSDLGRPLTSETLEYAWLVEVLAGDVTGRLTVPQLFHVVVGLEVFLYQAKHNDASLRPPQASGRCQHDLLQPSCPETTADKVCPEPDDVKYRMTRFSLDYLDVCIVESATAICVEAGPLRVTQCNLHAEESGLSLLLHKATVSQYAMPADAPWLKVGELALGPLIVDTAKRSPQGARGCAQPSFLRTHDARTRRLWFLWPELNRKSCCGCLGGCAFFDDEDSDVFGELLLDSQCDSPRVSPPGHGEDDEPRRCVLRQYSSPSHRNPGTVSFARSTSVVCTDSLDSRKRDSQLAEDAILHSTRGPSPRSVRRAVSTDSTHSSEAFFSADEDQGGEPDRRRHSSGVRASCSTSSSLDRRRRDPDGDSISSTSFISAMSSQEDVTLVNLHHQMDKPIIESPLLTACYAAHLSQFQVSQWDEAPPLPHLVARDGPSVPTHFLHDATRWKPRFAPAGPDGFASVKMTSKTRRLGSLQKDDSKDASATTPDAPGTAVVVRLKGDVDLMISPLMPESLRSLLDSVTPVLAAVHPVTVLGQLLARCSDEATMRHPLLRERPSVTPPAPGDLHRETFFEQMQVSVVVGRINVMALQCSVVEEVISFSALDNLKDLACVSVVALCLDHVQMQLLHGVQEQRSVQALPEHSPLLTRKPDPSLLLLLETSETSREETAASVSVAAVHAQLRRLKNSSSLLKEATLTTIPPYHSKVCFTFERQDWDKLHDDEKMGFIMFECGLEEVSARLVRRKGPEGDAAADSKLSFTSTDDSANSAEASLILAELHTAWFNFAAPPRTPNTHKIDFTRLDWHLLSTMTPSINAWLKPCDRLLVSVRLTMYSKQRRSAAVTSCLMADALDGAPAPLRGRLRQRLTHLSRALQEDPSCQLLAALCRHSIRGLPSEDTLRPEVAPSLNVLRRGLIALSRQWKNILYMPFLVEQSTRLLRYAPRPREPIQGVPPQLDETGDETARLLEEDASKGADSPAHFGGMVSLGQTLEHGISSMVAHSGRMRESRQSLATWSCSSVEPILRSALDDDEDLYNWMVRQRPTETPSPSAEHPSVPGQPPDARLVFEPLLEALGASKRLRRHFGTPRLAVSLLADLLRVDIVESEEPREPRRGRGPKGGRLFVDTTADTPSLVCDRLALDADIRRPGAGAATTVHLAATVQYVAQQVNVPLLRLLHQFSTMYENVKETRLELRANRAPSAKGDPGETHATQEEGDSVVAAEGVVPTPRCWKTMCFLLDLYEAMPPSKALADRFTVCVGTDHRGDASEGYRGNGRYEPLREHRIDMEDGDAPPHRKTRAPLREPLRPAHAEWVPLVVFGVANIKRVRLLAMLSGLRLESELSGFHASISHKELVRDGHRHSESSGTGQLSHTSVVLLEGQPPNHQMVVKMTVAKSQALCSSQSRKGKPKNAALVLIGAVNIDIPQHPVVLHGMMTRSGKQLSTTLQELRRAPARTSRPEEASPRTSGPAGGAATSDLLRPIVVQLSVVLDGLTVGAALLPSLRAHYHMGQITGTGVTGGKARFTVDLPRHSLSFNTKVPTCEANLPSRASVDLPPVHVSAEYVQDPGPSQKDADGVVLRRGSYLSALAEIGTFEHSLTTDLLNHLVLVQKVFMKEVNEVVQKMSGTKPLRLWEAGGVVAPPAGGRPLFLLQLRLRGIRLTATTPTASAVRLETGVVDLQLSNRVQNASRAPVGAAKLFGKGQVDLNLALGQLIKNALFEEAEFQQFAFFKTRICLRNALQDEMIATQYDDKEAVLITMKRPIIFFQPVALDKAVLVWLNYRNAYEYWNEQRGSLNKEVLTATQQVFERVPQFSQLSGQALGTLFLQLTVEDLGICMPLNKRSLPNNRLFDADVASAVVVTLENTRISACSCGSLVSKARFTGLCLRFAEDFDVCFEDWKPDPSDSNTTNLCVVSEGTYEICSRTIAAQGSSNAKWILNVQWQMEGVDIHVDVNISKALSALFKTLTALTGDDGDEMDDSAAQEPVVLRSNSLLMDPRLDAKKRSRLIEKEMNEQAKIISDLRFLGASQSTIEHEERRLKELEAAVFNDFRRDVIKKLRRQSVKQASSIKDKFGLCTHPTPVQRLPPPDDQGGTITPESKEESPTGSHTRTASFDMSDLPQLVARERPLMHREMSLDSVFSQTSSVPNSETPTPASEHSELGPLEGPRRSSRDGPDLGRATPAAPPKLPEPSIDFELDIKVFFNSGKCVLHTRDPTKEEEMTRMSRIMKKERSFSGAPGAGLAAEAGSPTRRRSGGNRSNLSSSRVRFVPTPAAGQIADFTIFLIPGLDVKVHYNSWTVGAESPSVQKQQDLPDGMLPQRKGGTKKAALFAWITLQSIPEETVISPHMLDFLEQALEVIPIQTNRASPPVAMAAAAAASGSDGAPAEDVSQYGSFPVDVIVYFRMQPSILRFSCLPVSRVECLLRLPSVDLAFSSQRADEGAAATPVGGLSATGCLADFSLYIFHPYGGAKKSHGATDASPLAATERKDSLSLQVEFVKVNMSRSRHPNTGSDARRGDAAAMIRFSTVCDVGSASFKYDMRRLTEILAFPKAWYRRSIARRMFLGDPAAPSLLGDQEDSAETSSSSGTMSPNGSKADSFPFSGVDLGSPEEDARMDPDSDGGKDSDQGQLSRPPTARTWDTLLLFAFNLSRLNVHMNMGNVMGNTSWLTRGFKSQGRLAVDSSGHKDMDLSVDLEGSSLDAKGGIVGGTIELSQIHTHMGLREHWGHEPVHTLRISLWASESRLDYMGTSVLMARLSGLQLSLRDEWRVGEEGLATRRPALLFVHGHIHWDQVQLLLSKSTTSDLVKMYAKLEEFFSQQLHSGKRVFSSLRLGGPRRMPRGQDSPEEEEARHHRHWQRALALVSGLERGPTLRLPRHGTLVGGTMDLRGANLSLACFNGVNFRSKAWALFSLRQPSISFATEAQDVVGASAVDTHVIQNLTFRLGPRGGAQPPQSMATVCRISRNSLFPPQFKTIHEWFHYAFATSELDDVDRFPVLEPREKSAGASGPRPNDPAHTMEMIFAFPSLELHLKTEHLQGERRPTTRDAKPVVECSFVTEFDDHIFVAVDAEAFFFLHDLIVSYIREKDGGGMGIAKNQSPDSERRKRSVADPLESLQKDWRDYQCYTWHLEPTVRLLSWAGKGIEPYGVDYILQKLGFSHARVTIPKWVQRGCMDPLDLFLSLLLEQVVRAVREDSP